MEEVMRKKEVALVAIDAVVTTAAVALAKAAGSVVVAALIAGAGRDSAITYVIFTNGAIEHASNRKQGKYYRPR